MGLQLPPQSPGRRVLYQGFTPRSLLQLTGRDLPSPPTSSLHSTTPGSILTVAHTSHPPQHLNMKDIWK